MGRQIWANRTTFLLAAIGSAVGLGNIWRFPYLTFKFGGGAFLIPYLIALFVIGIPLLMLEFAIGQKFQAGAVKSFEKIKKNWGGVGIFALINIFLIVTYYAVVMAWSLVYTFASFGVKWAGDSKGYFFGEVLQISDSVNQLGGINWTLLLALFVIWILIYFCVWKGVKSVGKIVWWTVPLPIIFIGVILIRGMTLPGFLEGWIFYLRPDWTALLSTEVWIAAIGQIFFTLSVAAGIMIAYSSFNKKDDVRSDTWWTALVNSGISLFAGFAVFAILGYMATNTGVSVADVAAAGPGLAFVVFPEALALIPTGAAFFSVLFFITLLTLGIDSAFSIVEGINTAIKDTKWGSKFSIEKISLMVCGLAFLMGIIYTTGAGLYILDIVDHFTNQFGMVLVGLLEAILIGWIYGADNLRQYINSVSKVKVGKFWNVAIKYIIPVVLIVLLVKQFITEVTTPYEGYPGWALSIGWTVIAIPILIFLVKLLKKPSAA